MILGVNLIVNPFASSFYKLIFFKLGILKLTDHQLM